MGKPCFDPWIRKIPWKREWLPTLMFLPGESHELRNLAGYNPQGRRESDMTEQLTLSRLETELRQNIKCSPFLESVLYYPMSMTKSERMSLQIHVQQHENFPPLWKQCGNSGKQDLTMGFLPEWGSRAALNKVTSCRFSCCAPKTKRVRYRSFSHSWFTDNSLGFTGNALKHLISNNMLEISLCYYLSSPPQPPTLFSESVSSKTGGQRAVTSKFWDGSLLKTALFPIRNCFFRPPCEQNLKTWTLSCDLIPEIPFIP